jgi:hypothetical protein
VNKRFYLKSIVEVLNRSMDAVEALSKEKFYLKIKKKRKLTITTNGV